MHLIDSLVCLVYLRQYSWVTKGNDLSTLGHPLYNVPMSDMGETGRVLQTTNHVHYCVILDHCLSVEGK